MNNQYFNKKSAGFTLLELVVVVAVMGLISTMALDVYTDNSNQKRYEATKNKVEEIRYAIIGDDSRSQLTISGFIADTGSAPTELRQLIMEEYCVQDPWYNTEADCTGAGYNWEKQQNNNWQGPYLQAYTTEVFSRKVGTSYVHKTLPVYRDSWGRTIRNVVEDTSNATEMNEQIEDMRNFGWIFGESLGDIALQSYGLDRLQNGSGAYEADYPTSAITFIPGHFYESGITTFSYEIENNSGSNATVCLFWSGTVRGNTGSQTITSGAKLQNNISMPTMGKVEFSLQKDADSDCDTNDGEITLTSYQLTVHKAITTPMEFNVSFSSVP